MNPRPPFRPPAVRRPLSLETAQPMGEKPLTLQSHESEELIEVADAAGLTLMVGHVFMFNPGIIRLKEEIGKGTGLPRLAGSPVTR